MKEFVIRFRALDKKSFLAIKTGHKSIETRAATPKYKRIKAGDVLIIICGNLKIKKVVKNVEIYPDPESLLDNIPLNQVFPDLHKKSEAIEVWHKFPGYSKKIEQYGLIAFYL